MPPSSVSSASLAAWRQISPTSATGSPHAGGRSTLIRGRGIGREVALALARGGCAVAVAARTRGELDAVAAEARRLGADAAAQILDVTDGASVTRAVTAVTATLGRVDVLVNNAGIAESAPFLKTDPEVWDRHLRVNVTGPYLLTP